MFPHTKQQNVGKIRDKKRHKLRLGFHPSGAYASIHSGLPFNNVIVLVNSDTKSLNFGLSLLIINAA